MATFAWVQTPPHGACNACGSSQEPRGYVNMLSTSIVHIPADDVQGRYADAAGIVDVHYCAICIEQAAGLIGSLDLRGAQELFYVLKEREEEIEKLKDEVLSERQRFQNMIETASAYREGFSAAKSQNTKGEK